MQWYGGIGAVVWRDWCSGMEELMDLCSGMEGVNGPV